MSIYNNEDNEKDFIEEQRRERRAEISGGTGTIDPAKELAYEKKLFAEMDQERKERKTKVAVHREESNKWGGKSQWVDWIDLEELTPEDRISDLTEPEAYALAIAKFAPFKEKKKKAKAAPKKVSKKK